MSTIDLNHVVSMNNVSVMNSNFDIIEQAINGDVIHAQGGQNVMKQDLDLNGHSLLNVVTNTSVPNSVLTTAAGDIRYYRQHNVPNPSGPLDAVNKQTLDSYNLPFGFFQQVGTGSVQRAWNSKVAETVSVQDFGVVANAAGDQSAAIQAAINATPLNGVLEFQSGVYKAKNLVVAKAITLKGVSYGKWGAVVGQAPNAPVGATLLLSGAATNLIKVGDVASANPVEGFVADNIVFTGGNNTPTDALVVLEQVQSPYFTSCNFAYTIGKTLRMRWVFEPLFSHCMFRSNDSSAVVGMVHIDSQYLSGLNNVNNLRFLDSCHFENNLGTYIYAATDSALDILEIADNKFEWGRASIPSNGPWPLFDIRACLRLNITNNTFTNFKAANKYDCILQVGDDSAPSSVNGSMEGNFFQNGDASTFIARIRGSSSMRIKNNQESNAQIQGLYGVTSKNAQDLEFWDSTSNALGQNRAKVGENLTQGFISAHKVSFNSNIFVADAASLSIPGTVISSAVASTVLLDVAPKKYTGSPVAVRFAVRARSATGTGTIDVISAGNSTQTFTLTSSYQTYIVDVSAASMASTPGQLYRVNVGSASPEAVFVDGVYIVPLIGPVAGALNGTLGATTPASVAATTISASGTITPSQTSGIVGTTTNNNANAGSVGEVIFATASSVALTNNTLANATSISLTAGDWDVSGGLAVVGSTSNITNTAYGANSVSATLGAAGTYCQYQAPSAPIQAFANAIPTQRVSIASTTTIFMVVQASFASGTASASGILRARRVR